MAYLAINLSIPKRESVYTTLHKHAVVDLGTDYY